MCSGPSPRCSWSNRATAGSRKYVSVSRRRGEAGAVRGGDGSGLPPGGQIGDGALDDPHAAQAELPAVQGELEELRKAGQNGMVARQLPLQEAPEPPHRPGGDERQAEQPAPERRAAAHRERRPALAELDVALLLPDRAQEDLADALVIESVDDAVQGHEDESLAHRHLEADVLFEGGGHHPRAEEPHQSMRRGGLLADEIEDAQEVVDVLELLHRLPREEARSVEIGSRVEPVAALDAGDLAVEELVHHPAQERAVAARLQSRAAPVERHLLAR